MTSVAAGLVCDLPMINDWLCTSADRQSCFALHVLARQSAVHEQLLKLQITKRQPDWCC